MHKRIEGFTIVEVAVVIIVIAILASLSAFGYSTYRSRVADTAVQSNLQSMAVAVEAFSQKHNRYPKNNTELASLGIEASRDSYPATSIALTYCANYTRHVNVSGATVITSGYGFVGRSSSGAIFFVTHKTGITQITRASSTDTATWNGSGAGLWCAARAELKRWDTTVYPYYEASVGRTYTANGDWAGFTK